ncbi:2258_t:CDS:1, partial [Ambispora leptoticha]
DKFGDLKLKDTVNEVLVPSYNITKNACTFFTNMCPEFEEYHIKDVIRASSAAPTYFPAKRIENDQMRYIDGGVFMNNPTAKAYLEAKRKYPDKKFVVVSLGTGFYEESLESLATGGTIDWIKPLIELLMNVGSKNVENTMNTISELDGISYYRFQPKLNEEVALDATGNHDIMELQEIAVKITNDPKFDELISMLVDKCKLKEGF